MRTLEQLKLSNFALWCLAGIQVGKKRNRFIRLGCDMFPTLLGTVARQNGHPFHNTLASLNKWSGILSALCGGSLVFVTLYRSSLKPHYYTAGYTETTVPGSYRHKLTFVLYECHLYVLGQMCTGYSYTTMYKGNSNLSTGSYQQQVDILTGLLETDFPMTMFEEKAYSSFMRLAWGVYICPRKCILVKTHAANAAHLQNSLFRSIYDGQWMGQTHHIPACWSTSAGR